MKRRMVAFALGLALAAGAWGTAHADMAGADIPILLDLLLNSFTELERLREAARAARETAEEVQRLRGYAEDARRTFESFGQYTAQMFGEDVLGALDRAFPDVGALHRSAGGGAYANGELNRLVRLCLERRLSGAACVEVEQALSYEDARTAIARAFGPLREDAAPGQHAVRAEAALGVAAASSQVARGTLARAHSRALLAECTGTGAQAQAACEAAANAAAIRELALTADVADQQAQTNRLLSTRLLQEDEARTRELQDAEDRRRAVLDAAMWLGVPPPAVRSGTGDFLGQEGGR